MLSPSPRALKRATRSSFLPFFFKKKIPFVFWILAPWFLEYLPGRGHVQSNSLWIHVIITLTTSAAWRHPLFWPFPPAPLSLSLSLSGMLSVLFLFLLFQTPKKFNFFYLLLRPFSFYRFHYFPVFWFISVDLILIFCYKINLK